MHKNDKITGNDLIDFLVKWRQLLMEGTTIWLPLSLTSPLIKKHTDRNSVSLPDWSIKTTITMAPLFNQWESLLKMIPRLNVLKYPYSYSALFNLHTLRTICECRWQPTLSHENRSCTRDKDGLIWLQDMLLPKTQVYHIPTVSPCCLVFQF